MKTNNLETGLGFDVVKALFFALFFVFVFALITRVITATANHSPSPFKIWKVGNNSYLFSGYGGLGCIDTVQNVSYVSGYETGGLLSSCVPIQNNHGINITATCVATTYGTPLPYEAALKVLNQAGVSNMVCK